MKETIEWFSVFNDSERPREEERLLADEAKWRYTRASRRPRRNVLLGHGFILDGGKSVSPAMGCYFPKGEQ